MRTLGFLRRAAAVALALASSWALAAAVPKYRVEMAQARKPDSLLNVQFTDLNNLGQVVGTRYFDNQYAGFLYGDGKFQQLDIGGRDFEPQQINDRGDIAGRGGSAVFLYNGGKAIDLTSALDPRVKAPTVQAMNQRGEVVIRNIDPEYERHFLYDGQSTRYLSLQGRLPGLQSDYFYVLDMNDRGTMLGAYQDEALNQTRLFLIGGGVATSIPLLSDRINTFALNNAGDVVGQGRLATGEYMPVIYRDGMPVSLGSLGGIHQFVSGGYAEDINNQGWIVGTAAKSFTEVAAFLYRDGRMHDLNDLLVARDAAQWQLSSASEINDRGQMLAFGTAKGGDTGAWMLLTPVPEAQTWALMLAGLGVVGAVARRRARQLR